MATLRAVDLGPLIELIYDAALDPGRWQDVAHQLSLCFDGVSALIIYDHQRHQTPYSIWGGMESSSIDAFNSYYAPQNPYMTAGAGWPTGKIAWAHDLVAPSVMVRTEYYNDFLLPAEVSLSHPGIKLIEQQDVFVTLSVCPSQQVLEQDAASVAHRVNSLKGHLTRALEINRKLALAEQVHHAFDQMMESLTVAALLLDAQNRILYANAHAEQLMRRELVIGLDRFRQLKAAKVEDQEPFLAFLSRPPYPVAMPLQLRSARTGRRYIAWRVPMAPSPGALSARTMMAAALVRGACSLLLVAPVDRALRIPPEAIAAAFALTTAEAKLAASLVAGETLTGYAAVNGIATSTARNQLASVFDKTGTSRQSELVARITAALGVLAAG